ncbi:MAG: histidine--tRNA ligase, partial [Candidatus Hydrogenedentes bacterium]|nr:histidine--tRNA ligase [Candidatus Hydrogenedentota bacterium]
MKDIEQKAPKVEARTVKGCQDLFPEDMIPRKKVIRAIEDVFEKYGFLPIETPALEHLETLLGAGGEETNKELFRLESPEGEPIALRFDMTVPFARLLAQYPDKLKTPFRRYACGPVWRADKPGPGRFRQFTQFDIDAAGSESVAVDAEIVAIMTKVMRTRAVGVKDFTVLVNNRKVVDALLYGHNVRCPARHRHVLRVVDKLAKVGLENVRLELGEGRIDESGDPIPGVKLDAETIDGLLAFLAIEADTRRGVVDAMAAALPPSEQTTAALTEMEELASSLDALGVDEKYALFSPSLTRGLDYYTGPVFETILPNAPEFGAVMGGGRYNQLVARFLDEAIPCTGMSIGLDRLMAARQHGKITADLACTLDDVKSSSTAYTGVAARQHGKITVDLARTLGDVKLSSTAYTGVAPAAKTTVQALIMTLGNVPVSEAMRTAAEL